MHTRKKSGKFETPLENREEIEHIGSTSIPGLAAKPIIDIMAGVETLEDADRCIEPLQTLGWISAPELAGTALLRREVEYLKSVRSVSLLLISHILNFDRFDSDAPLVYGWTEIAVDLLFEFQTIVNRIRSHLHQDSS
jgi:GrpB-like predicted nucleotidyltransferase (UPF0157 family)